MALFEPRIPRDLATRLGEEAVAISTAGQYAGPAGLVQIGPAKNSNFVVLVCVRHTHIFNNPLPIK